MNLNLAKFIDHTLLKPTASAEQISQLCQEARAKGFASVCINPQFVPLAAQLLQDSNVKVCTVVGFPLGANTLATKLFEAQEAIKNGAEELDYVINQSHVLTGDYDLVLQEMQSFVALKKEQSREILVKVILETCYLSPEQIIKLCQLARQAGLDFVKTSTGFGTGGASVEHIRLMRQAVGDNMGVKASGGIRNHADAMIMINAGANRIGASAGLKIIAGQ